MARIIFGLMGVLAMAIAAFGSVIEVPQEQSTIQSAIEQASDGDTILVSPGAYDENIDFSGKNVTVTSLDPNDPDIVSTTIIFRQPQLDRFGNVLSTNDNGSIVSFVHGETAAAVLSGFTIKGGHGTPQQNIYYGAGIYCEGSEPRIIHNVITQNMGPTNFSDNGPIGYGGGICCMGSEAFIAYNTIVGNAASAGGGILSFASSDLYFCNIIYDNKAYVGGGVVTIGGRLISNTLANNGVINNGIGGNLYLVLSEGDFTTEVSNNIIFGAQSGYGILTEGGDLGDWFAYNNVYGNKPDNYVDSSTGQPSNGPTGQHGNLAMDPQFVDPSGKDYRLMENSPCIDAGDPLFESALASCDFDGNLRVYGAAIDMGAFENTVCTRPIADAGLDQTVTLNQIVTLSGTDSLFCDPNAPQRFVWDQLEGPAVSLSDVLAVNPTFTPIQTGTYVFELLVSDSMVFGRPDKVVITVTAQ